LVKDDGQSMLESMEMVKYIDAAGEKMLVGPERPEIVVWADQTANKTAPLTWPRYPLLGLPEFATIAAHDHYIIRKRKALGDLVEHRANAREYLRELAPQLERLDDLIQSDEAVNGRLSMDDIRVLPLLRSAAVVKGLQFPRKVRDYFETMMSRIGYQPLPAV
jgi:glutaredoxin 2